MTAPAGLAGFLAQSAARVPDKVGVAVAVGHRISYTALHTLSDRLRDRLWHLGVRPGDRVGLRLHKSIDAVVALFGILKCGAAYVPVDAESPAPRGAFILNDCQVKVVITEQAIQGALTNELARIGAAPIVVGLPPGAPVPIAAWLDAAQADDPAPTVPTVSSPPDAIAYILYTSGSTGNPKGVVLTHGNAASFIDWCSTTFEPRTEDVFSSHAPFHFDLSILDIYVAIKHGCTLVLFDEALGKDPLRLGAAIAKERITIWYSTPSILSLLADHGKLERHDCSSLRMVFFAGEVFPIPRFKTLHNFWRHPRFVNLYGPTETNVCTYFEVPADDSWEAWDTFPIGTICVPNRGRVVDDEGRDVARGQPGELVVCGPNVMSGYWNLAEQNARAFLVDERGERWYRTGDVVTELAGGGYKYHSRRDRMVKRRGYRVELGEIEAGLLREPNIREAAVVAVPDQAAGVRIVAFVKCAPDGQMSVIALKAAAHRNLPPYMAPDVFVAIEALPRTSTDKVDLQALKRMASGDAG